MKNRMNIQKSIVMIVAVMAVLAVAMAGTASAKSAYVIASWDTSPNPINAYDIQGNNLVYQATNTVPYHGYGAMGLTIDTDSKTLFVSYEASNIIEKINAETFEVLGSQTAAGASNGAGIVVDQPKGLVYWIDRGTCDLYIYDVATFTLQDTVILPTGNGGWGMAVSGNRLFVGDFTNTVRYYDTTSWVELGSITLSYPAVGMAVDDDNGFLYAGSYTGSNYLMKYDLINDVESTVNVGAGIQVRGVAVDQATGHVYITSGEGWSNNGKVEVYDSNLNFLSSNTINDDPTGICVPAKDISYNPLNFDKDDGLGGACVNAGGTITYTLSYSNPTGNPDVTGVTIVDTLPSEVTYQSCTGGGTQAGNTVTWNIGTVTGGTSGSVTLTVQVNAGTEGTTIDNSATIDSAETPPTTVHEFTTVCTGVGPTVESALLSGNPENTFQISDPVYAVGSGYPAASTTYDLYVVYDTTWTDGMAIPARVAGTETSVTTDASKNIPAGTLIWTSAVGGKYDIVVDVNGDGDYDAGIDALDANIDVGFEAIPEFTTIMIPAAMILGMVFLMHRRKREE